MVSNQLFSPLIAEALEELNFKDMEGLCPTLQKLLNELMLIERERALKALYPPSLKNGKIRIPYV